MNILLKISPNGLLKLSILFFPGSCNGCSFKFPDFCYLEEIRKKNQFLGFLLRKKDCITICLVISEVMGRF